MIKKIKRVRAFIAYWYIIIVPPWWFDRFSFWVLPWAGEYAYAEDVANMSPSYARADALYDHLCPGGDRWSRDCIARGECGCSNDDAGAAA